MQLSDIRKVALGRFGIVPGRFGEEDELFPNAVLHDLINEKHRWLAEEARCYRQTLTLDLPQGSGGISTVPLDCIVIEVLPETLQVQLSGTWRRLAYRPEEELRRELGAFGDLANGTPRAWFLKSGAALDGQRVLALCPGADAAVTGGVRIDAYVYPSLMTSDTDTPALQPAEHRHLIPAVCWGMAEMELSRGRPGAELLVAHWQRAAEKAAEELRCLIQKSRRAGPRRIRCTR